MTKFDTVDGYDPYRNLSRQEAAKIFSNFAINVLCRQPNKKLMVNYSDTQESDPTLKPYIELAYQLGIMKGSGQGDGVFRPFEFISKAEVNAVLIRMLLKSYLDETGMLRYAPYNQTSSALNIITFAIFFISEYNGIVIKKERKKTSLIGNYDEIFSISL